MKKNVSLFSLTLLVSLAFGQVTIQDMQLHYDFKKDREYFTSTFQYLKLDENFRTNWFTFIDFDYGGENGPSLAYFELMKYFNVGFSELIKPTIQYNGGLITDGGDPFLAGVNAGNIFLFGGNIPIKIGNVAISTDLMYRWDEDSNGGDAQLTLVWYQPINDSKFIITGFFDVWSRDKANFGGGTGKHLVLLTEPQFWWYPGKKIGIGGEIEISKNFLPGDNFSFDEWNVFPTIGTRVYF